MVVDFSSSRSERCHLYCGDLRDVIWEVASLRDVIFSSRSERFIFAVVGLTYVI